MIFGYIQGFWKYNFGGSVPRSMMINLTYKCNSKCVMCNIWKRKVSGELDIYDWYKILDDKIFCKIEEITLSGGEIFLIDNIDEYVELFEKKLPNLEKIILNTNGILTDNIYKKIVKILEILEGRNIKIYVGVSIDGVGNKHNQIRGVENNFEMAEKLLDKFIDIKNRNIFFDFGVASVLMKKNIDDIEAINKWAKRKRIKNYFQMIGFNDTFVKNFDSQKDLDFDKLSKLKLKKTLLNLSKPKGWFDFVAYYWKDVSEMIFENKNRTTPCLSWKNDLVIDANGDMYYCLNTKPIGNFRNDFDLSKIYYDSKNLKNRKLMRENMCKKCMVGCGVYKSLAFDLKRYLWFRLSGKTWRNFGTDH